MGYLLSPPTRQFFEDFGSFVSYIILALFGSFGSRVIICAIQWGIYCPLQLGIFLGIVGSFSSHVIICALRWGIYCPFQLTPPTRRFFGDFWKFCFTANFLCPWFQGIYCPLQLASPTWQFFGDFCVLHAALAACVCCSIFSISRMMCGIGNSLRMFW